MSRNYRCSVCNQEGHNKLSHLTKKDTATTPEAFRSSLNAPADTAVANAVDLDAAVAKLREVESADPAPTQIENKWKYTEPIWPKRGDVAGAVAPYAEDVDTELAPRFQDTLASALRSRFKHHWSQAFSKPDPERKYHILANPPSNDREGWSRRKEVFRQSCEDIEGAVPVKGTDLSPGMAVYAGNGLKIVHYTVTYLDEDGTPEHQTVFYTDGHNDRVSSPDSSNRYVRLPKLDRPVNRGMNRIMTREQLRARSAPRHATP